MRLRRAQLGRTACKLTSVRDAGESDQRLIAASGLFDVSYYLINGADVAAAGADPVAYCCLHGWREGRRPNLFLGPDWYSSRYLGAGSPNRNPLVHYIREGEEASRKPRAALSSDQRRVWRAPPANVGVSLRRCSNLFLPVTSWLSRGSTAWVRHRDVLNLNHECEQRGASVIVLERFR